MTNPAVSQAFRRSGSGVKQKTRQDKESIMPPYPNEEMEAILADAFDGFDNDRSGS
jgi:hypothetical protein